MFGNLKKPFFVLAPMDDVTDSVFRQIVSGCAAPDLCFSEFVNVDGLMSQGRPRLIRKLDRAASEPPLVAHIWGLNPDNFYAIADQIASGQLAEELGMEQNFAGIDLNMGCPVKQVIKVGACSALIKDHKLAEAIIKATKAGSKNRLPVSVKTRIGFSKTEHDWTGFLLKQELAMLTLHLRTVKEASLVPAHWDELEQIIKQRDKIAKETLIVANGDITTRLQGEAIASKYGVDGIMIGRGVFADPYVFSDQSPWASTSEKDRLNLFRKHLVLFNDWSATPDKAVKRLNKYAKIYINGFSGAKEHREEIASANSISEMLDYIAQFETVLV